HTHHSTVRIHTHHDTKYYITPSLPTCLLFFQDSADHQNLHSFPTRRSSDLEALQNAIKHSGSQQIQVSLSVELNEIRLTDLIQLDRKSTRLNSSHVSISYAVFCLKKKKLK